MKYCSNCGAEMDEKAVICVKCGVPVAGSNVTQQSQTIVKKESHGGATASLVLGILGLVFAIISILIALVITYSANFYGDYYTSEFIIEKLITSLVVIALPGILSLIGLPIGIFCKRGSGAKIAGIILNAITILICAADVLLIMYA